jgi:hypothetical protein
MADTGHKQTSDRIEFCRVPNCKQSNYRDVCPVTWKSEAHHILCVASINGVLKGRKIEVLQVVNESKWCINSEKNMVALPVWGTTVMYYCNYDRATAKSWLSTALTKGLSGGLPSAAIEPPTFANLPHHNYGHLGQNAATSYQAEIDEALEDWITQVQVDIQSHAIKGEDIHSDLDTMADEMRKLLMARARRGGGTHAAWTMPGPAWYEPFSMAVKPTPMPFPAMIKRIASIAATYW